MTNLAMMDLDAIEARVIAFELDQGNITIADDIEPTPADVELMREYNSVLIGSGRTTATGAANLSRHIDALAKRMAKAAAAMQQFTIFASAASDTFKAIWQMPPQGTNYKPHRHGGTHMAAVRKAAKKRNRK